MSRDTLPIQWIRPLAAPYLRGYRATIERARGLRGYSFHVSPLGAKDTLGFFVGYLTEPIEFSYLKPEAPECLIFAFVEPATSALHAAQVRDKDGTLRWTFEYIRWLTHRPPRFELFENKRAAMVRHFSMREWPVDKYEHFSRNFYTETLAWLVRSGLVRRWRDLCEKKEK